MKKNRLVLLTAILALAGLSGCGKNQGDSLANDFSVTGVELDPTYARIEVDETLQITPTIHFKDDQVVECYQEWRSSNPNILSVSENGLVTAHKSGYAAITFIAGFKSASCSITVPDNNSYTPVNPIDPDNPVVPGQFTISLDSTSLTLGADDTFQLNATTSEQATVTWTSSNPSAATVDENGLIIAVAEGNTVITATANGVNATCDVTIVNEVQPDVPPSDDMTMRIYFFIDYNNVDEDDLTGKKLLSSFWWYPDRPVGQSNKVPATPKNAPTPEFPYFAGWSIHPIIDSRDDLIDVNTYVLPDEMQGRSFLYIYGIWTDVQGGM